MEQKDDFSGLFRFDFSDSFFPGSLKRKVYINKTVLYANLKDSDKLNFQILLIFIFKLITLRRIGGGQSETRNDFKTLLVKHY